MNLSALCKKYPKLMRVFLGMLLLTGVWFLIVAIVILIENAEDWLDGVGECFSFVLRGHKNDR